MSVLSNQLSKIPISKHRINTSSPEIASAHASGFVSRIPKAVSPVRSLPSPDDTFAKDTADSAASFARRISPPSGAAPKLTRSDSEEARIGPRTQIPNVDLDAQLHSKVSQSRNSSVPDIRTKFTSPRKKSSVTSPSRIPVASEMTHKTCTSSNSSDSQPSSTRTSPSRSVSPQKRPAPTLREATFSRSEEKLEENHSKCQELSGSDSSFSKIPLPKSSKNQRSLSTSSSSPSPTKVMPTLGFSFSPERLLPPTQREATEEVGREDREMAADTCDTHDEADNVKKKKKKNFEAFMMTGDRMISLAKTPAHLEFKSNYPKSDINAKNHTDMQEKFLSAIGTSQEEVDKGIVKQPPGLEAETFPVLQELSETDPGHDISGLEPLEDSQIAVEDQDQESEKDLESDPGPPQRPEEGHSEADIPSSAAGTDPSVPDVNNLMPETEPSIPDANDLTAERIKQKEISHTSITTISSEEESDIDSLHSYHPPVKVIDVPSAVRLAKRLYTLDGFKKTDVSRHLSKNTDYNHVVAQEYLKYFTFDAMTLDSALKDFLSRFCLTGETQERERVLFHFSKRFVECNPDVIGEQFKSQDSVHTLTCAIMLLNTDLHGDHNSAQLKRMTCTEFVENLSELNDGTDFPNDLLKRIYFAIKDNPIPWASPSEDKNHGQAVSDHPKNISLESNNYSIGASAGGVNMFLSVPDVDESVDYKNGYLMRKACFDANGRKTKMGKRSWKMYYLTLRDMVLYCFKDKKCAQNPDFFRDPSCAIRIHHALAVRAADYTKKQFVFRLYTADQAQYLFQTSDEKELLTWIDAINSVVATFSSQMFPAPVSNNVNSFQRPLMPSSKSSLNPEQQLEAHEKQLMQFREEIEQQLQNPLPRGNKQKTAINAYRDKIEYLKFEIMRYETYVLTLKTKSHH